jgi:thiol-disulfide isomerase/thioredoxin
MRVRWLVAGLAVALILLVVMIVTKRRAAHARRVLSAAACPVDAKAANLDFAMKDMTGRTVKLADYKGKVILLDFWATWCGPCKYEIPGFVQLQEQYGKNGLQVLGVSVDDTVDKLEPFVKQFRMNYPVLLGLGHDEVQDAYGPMIGIPVSVIIARDGRICAKHMGLPPTKSSSEPLEQSIKKTFEAEITALLPSSL